MTGSPHEREKLTAPQDLEPEYHTSKGSDIDDSDQPRVAQWIDEGDLDEDQSDDETPSETYSSSGVDIEDNYVVYLYIIFYLSDSSFGFL